jgi:hypothetical protein
MKVTVFDAYRLPAQKRGHLLLGLAGMEAPKEYEDNAVYDADVVVHNSHHERRMRTTVAVVPRIVLASGELIPYRHFIVVLDAIDAFGATLVELSDLQLTAMRMDELRAQSRSRDWISS